MVEACGVTAGNLKRLAEELLDSWSATTDARLKRKTFARDIMVFSYALHTHHLAVAYLKLAEQDLWTQAYPTLRTCWELAVSAQWVYSTNGAIEISFYEAERNRKNLVASALDARFVEENEGKKRLAEIQKELDQLEEVKKSGLPTTFKGVCDDLNQGSFAYLTYRMLSHYCHAGPGVADIYVRLDDDGWIKEFGDPNDSEPEHRAALYYLCVSLIWAGRAAEAVGKATGRRKQLRDAARLLGVPDYLQQSDKAVIRSMRGKNAPSGKSAKAKG